jgi:hypothetical protein
MKTENRLKMGVVPENRGLINEMAMCFLIISRSRLLLWTFIEGSLEVKLPTIWTDGKTEVGRVREEKRRERVRRKKMQLREKVETPRFTAFFPMICGPGRLKSRRAKAAGAETSGQMRDEKLHVVVARCAFRSQNGKRT